MGTEVRRFSLALGPSPEGSEINFSASQLGSMGNYFKIRWVENWAQGEPPWVRLSSTSASHCLLHCPFGSPSFGETWGAIAPLLHSPPRPEQDGGGYRCSLLWKTLSFRTELLGWHLEIFLLERACFSQGKLNECLYTHCLYWESRNLPSKIIGCLQMLKCHFFFYFKFGALLHHAQSKPRSVSMLAEPSSPDVSMNWALQWGFLVAFI